MTGTVTVKKAVALRYASALLALASERGQEDTVLQDLQSLKQALGQSSELVWLFTNPAVSSQQATALIEKLRPVLSVGETVYGLLLILARRGRLNVFSEVEAHYAQLLQKRRQQMVVTITSAAPMPMPQFEQLARMISEKLSVSVRAEAKIDPALKAGFTVQAGSLMIDASLRTKLDHLQRAMKEGNI